MSRLDHIQRSFQAYVLGDAQAQAPILAEVADQRGLSAAARLAIYHRAYRSRLREALGEAYGKTWAYLGDAMFDELAAGYLEAHPSQHGNLRWFGAQLAPFAARVLPDYPFVAELAAFEWALGLAFDAADAEPLTADALGSLTEDDWAGQRFALHPSVQLLAMNWNTVPLWQALSREQEPPEAEPSAAAVVWLLWRQREQPHFRSLSPFEAAALRDLAAGLPFAELCGAAGEDLTRELAGCLQNWLACGLLVSPPSPSGG